MSLPVTPSQTVGPFFAIGLPWDDGPYAAAEDAPGAIRVSGRVLDGAGDPVPDALVETWQADPPAAAGFHAFARCPADDDGRWFVVTLPPWPVPALGGGVQAPHLAVSALGRGLLHRVVTRVYFPEHAGANAADPVLAAVPAARRATLLARRTDDGYAFDIRLQGPGETVFFDV